MTMSYSVWWARYQVQFDSIRLAAFSRRSLELWGARSRLSLERNDTAFSGREQRNRGARGWP